MSVTHPAQVSYIPTGGAPKSLADELDALATFTQNGAGAVARTITSKLSDFVNVRDFGALGDGTTDDTAAVQLALAAAGGKTLLFLGGTFKVTDSLAVSIAGTRIEMRGAKIFMAFPVTHATGRLFYVSASNVEFDGVWIDSTGTAATTNASGGNGNKYPIQIIGTSGTHLTNIKVSRCRFTNLPWADAAAVLATHCIYAQYVDGFTVQDCVIDTVGGSAVFMSVVTGARIVHNDINNTGWYSIQCNDGVDGFRISGNRITGTLPNTRVWGGSINLMSNGSTGAHLGNGLATIRHGEIDHNYISGVHSYTAAVHIESSSHIRFHHNVLEKISLTYGMTTYPGAPFYADGTPPNYVRVYARPLQPDPSGTEGPNDHIDISNNDMIANGVSCIAIYADAQGHGVALAYSDTLTVRENTIVSLDTSNYFAKAVIVHGQDGGFKNVGITKNMISGFPDSSSPVSGLIGIVGLTGAPILDTQIEGNNLTVVGGTPSSTTHLGIAIDAFTQRTLAQGNIVNGFWNGIRSFTNTGIWYLGSGNSFTASGSADYLLTVAPSVAVGTSVRYGSLLLTGRGSALAASSVVALAPAGEYRLSIAARTTTSGTGTTATVNALWTDEGGAKTQVLGTFALNAVDVTGQINATLFLHSVVNANIQVSVTGTFGTSLYAISATAEKLN